MKFTTRLYMMLGFLVSLGFVAVSAFMNFKYGLTRGNTPESAMLYGGFSLLADIFKVLLPLFIVSFFFNKQFLSVIMASFLFSLLVIYSLFSGFGFAKSDRVGLSQEVVSYKEKLKELKADLKIKKHEKAELPKHRPLQTVQAAINAAKQSRRWESTKNCLEGEVTARKSRIFCSNYNVLLGELSTAQVARKFETKISSLQTRINNIETQNTRKIGDVQAKLLVSSLGLTEDNAQSYMSGFLAILTELCSSFGLVFTMIYWKNHQKEVLSVKTKQPVVTRKSKNKVKQPPKPQATKTNKPLVATTPKKPKVKMPQVHVQKPDNENVPQPEVIKSEVINIPAASFDKPATKKEVTLSDFLAEYIKSDKNGFILHDRLYAEFIQWCQQRQCDPLGELQFIKAIEITLSCKADSGYYKGYSMVA